MDLFRVAAHLFVIGGQYVQSRLRFQAANDSQPVSVAAADEVVGEDAGVVIAASRHIEVQRRSEASVCT